MTEREYLTDALVDALAEHAPDATLTRDQIQAIAADLYAAHESCADFFSPPPSGPSPMQLENESLKRELRAEHEKVHCRACDGKGSVYDGFAISQCVKCGGHGRIGRKP